MEDLSDAIMLLSSGTYTVTRPGPSTLSQGRKVASSPTTFPIVASIQPTAGQTLSLVPEGYRDRDTFLCYTSTELKTSSGANQEPDVVTYRGIPHQVVGSEPWAELGNFYRCILVAPPS